MYPPRTQVPDPSALPPIPPPPAPPGYWDMLRAQLGGYLDELLQRQAQQPPVITNPLAVVSTPGAAFIKGATTLFDQPGNYQAAAAAAAHEALRAPWAKSVSELPALSEEARARGVDIPAGPSLVLDILGDPTNLLGGDPFTDIGKVGVAAMAFGAKKMRSLKALVTVAKDIQAVRSLFPRVDKYGKPAGLISGATILKRLETATDLSPEVTATLTELAEEVGTNRISADQLHALVQGQEYTPARVLRKLKELPEGAKQKVGAPVGVATAADERALRERYLRTMEQGIAGRDWYEEAGKALLFAANDDPARARLIAGDLAITSPTASVGANTGFGVKGYNQAIAGVPIEAGRYPMAMGKSIGMLHAGGEGSLGLKRDPFATNIGLGGGFQDLAPDAATRAVHDIWDAEAHGYVTPTGEPLRTGFGPAQHRWMDLQQDKIIAAANARALGGFRDWNELRTQAAAWVGQKVKAGDIRPEDAVKSYANYLAELVAQGSRETIPGKTTGHLPELHRPGMVSMKQLLHDIMLREGGIYDRQMRDQIAAGYGALVGRSFEGPGVYEGVMSPGMQTQVLTGSLEKPGGLPGERMLDLGSKRLLDAIEATYALGMGQDAYAYSRVLPVGSGGIRTGWEVTLPGGTISWDQMQQADQLLRGTNVIPIPTPTGVRLATPYGEPPSGAQVKAAVKALGGKMEEAGAFRSGYGEVDWRTQQVGQGFMENIRALFQGPEKFDRFAPAMFDRIRRADAMFRRETNGRFTLSPVLDEVRATVAGEGWAGLERLAKKYAIPVTLLAAGLATLTGSAQEGQPVQQ